MAAPADDPHGVPDAEAQRLEAAVREAVAGERRRLAKLLHDSVSQSLTGAYFQSQVLIKKLETACPHEARQIAELGDMIHRGVTELAEITRTLHQGGG